MAHELHAVTTVSLVSASEPAQGRDFLSAPAALGQLVPKSGVCPHAHGHGALFFSSDLVIHVPVLSTKARPCAPSCHYSVDYATHAAACLSSSPRRRRAIRPTWCRSLRCPGRPTSIRSCSASRCRCRRRSRTSCSCMEVFGLIPVFTFLPVRPFFPPSHLPKDVAIQDCLADLLRESRHQLEESQKGRQSKQQTPSSQPDAPLVSQSTPKGSRDESAYPPSSSPVLADPVMSTGRVIPVPVAPIVVPSAANKAPSGVVLTVRYRVVVAIAVASRVIIAMSLLAGPVMSTGRGIPVPVAPIVVPSAANKAPSGVVFTVRYRVVVAITVASHVVTLRLGKSSSVHVSALGDRRDR